MTRVWVQWAVMPALNPRLGLSNTGATRAGRWRDQQLAARSKASQA